MMNWPTIVLLVSLYNKLLCFWKNNKSFGILQDSSEAGGNMETPGEECQIPFMYIIPPYFSFHRAPSTVFVNWRSIAED